LTHNQVAASECVFEFVVESDQEIAWAIAQMPFVRMEKDTDWKVYGKIGQVPLSFLGFEDLQIQFFYRPEMVCIAGDENHVRRSSELSWRRTVSICRD